MDDSGIQRRLTCIMAADAVGYSRMMSQNEARTVQILGAHRAVIDGIIAFHQGRIFNTAGDSVLAEFSSVVEAVRCASEIQDSLKTRNDSLPDHERMQFRIGINLGEVIVKGNDLLGDGVNVAARLESVAEPGEVLLSASTYEQIQGKLNMGFDDLGEKSLKNIARPVRAFRVAGAQPAAPAASLPAREAPASRGARQGGARTIVIGVALAAAVAIAGFLALRSPTRDPAPASPATAPATPPATTGVATTPDTRPPTPPPPAPSPATPAPAAPPVVSAAPTASAPINLATRDGPWRALLQCEGAGDEGRDQDFTVTRGEFVIERGTPGKPGYHYLSGRPAPDGRLTLSGSGIAGADAPKAKGRPLTSRFEGQWDGNRYPLSGSVGPRPCKLILTPRS